VENKCSEVFLYLIIFLLEKRPFSKSTLTAYSGLKKNNLSIKSPSMQKKLIASPSLQSKFSPSITISKSPTISKKSLQTNPDKKLLGEGMSMLNKLTGKSEDPKNKLLQYANNTTNKTSDEKDDVIGKNNPIRKRMHNLKNLEENIKVNAQPISNVEVKSPSLAPVRKYENEGYVNIKTNNDDVNEVEQVEDIRNEGFLFKITNNKKFKKLWFKQIGKDLYCKFYYIILL
jgi:hypothetical protein